MGEKSNITMKNMRKIIRKPFFVAHSYSSLVAVTPIFFAAKKREKIRLNALPGMHGNIVLRSVGTAAFWASLL